MLEAVRRGTICDDPTMDDHPVRTDLCREFAVLCVVHRNDVSTSHTHTRHHPCGRLRDCVIWRSHVVVHLLTAKGDWLLSTRDFGSRRVPARAGASDAAHQLTSAHQLRETYGEITGIEIKDRYVCRSLVSATDCPFHDDIVRRHHNRIVGRATCIPASADGVEVRANVSVVFELLDWRFRFCKSSYRDIQVKSR